MSVYIGTSGEIQNVYIGHPSSPKDLLTNVVYYYAMQGDGANYTGTAEEALTTTGGVVSYGENYATLTSAILRNSALSYSGSAQTIGMWLKYTSASEIMSASYDGLSAGWGLGIQTTQAVVVVGGSSYSATYNSKNTSGVWHFVCSTYDGTALSGYVDGALTGSYSKTGSARSTKGISIGRFGYGSATYTGDVGICFLTESSMSADDVLAFYNATKSLYGL